MKLVYRHHQGARLTRDYVSCGRRHEGFVWAIFQLRYLQVVQCRVLRGASARPSWASAPRRMFVTRYHADELPDLVFLDCFHFRTRDFAYYGSKCFLTKILRLRIATSIAYISALFVSQSPSSKKTSKPQLHQPKPTPNIHLNHQSPAQNPKILTFTITALLALTATLTFAAPTKKRQFARPSNLLRRYWRLIQLSYPY